MSARWWRRATAFAGTVLAACTMSGCGAVAGVSSVAGGLSPSGDGYPIRIEFANVLNLPSGAPVVADGVRVGQLTGVRIDRRGFVITDVVIDDGVKLPVSTKAILRQSAPLSDVHIALTTDRSSVGPDLVSGGTIHLANTMQAPQIEDTMSNLANAVGNGTFGNFMTTVRELNRAFPDDVGSTADTFEVIGRDLEDLAAHQKSLSAMINGIDANARTVIENREIVDPLLTSAGVVHTTEAMSSIVGILFILTGLGQIAPPAQWLVPLVRSMDKAVAAVVPMLFGRNPLDTSSPSNLRRLTELLNHDLIPFVENGPKVDVTEVTVGGPSPVTLSAGDSSRQIIQVMRMIGLVR